MTTQKEIVRGELIGLSIEVIDAKNPSVVGIKGKIIDETKNTIVIQSDKVKKLIKNQIKMKIKLKDKIIEIDGKNLVGRPEDRIKK